MSAIKITRENFEQEVLNSDKPVLLDFWAEWCGPCQMLLPVVEELAKEMTDVKICKINVDDQRELAKQFTVMSIPTLIVMKDGKVTERTVGVKSREELIDMVK